MKQEKIQRKHEFLRLQKKVEKQDLVEKEMYKKVKTLNDKIDMYERKMKDILQEVENMSGFYGSRKSKIIKIIEE